jgi:hypothetical protein
MRNLLSLAVVAAACCLCVSLASASQLANLLTNPGFEGAGGVDGKNPGVARHWQNTDGIWHPGWYDIDGYIKHSGKSSQRICYIRGISDPWASVWQFTPEGSVTPGRWYRASVWCRTQGIVDKWGWLRLTVRFMKPGEPTAFGEVKAERIENEPEDWHRVSVTVQAPEEATRIQFLVSHHTESGIVWYDDAEVVELPRAPATPAEIR